MSRMNSFLLSLVLSRLTVPCSGMSWTKMSNQWCRRGATFLNLEAAQTACLMLGSSFCPGVYDERCDGREPSLCQGGVIRHLSTASGGGSCLYKPNTALERQFTPTTKMELNCAIKGCSFSSEDVPAPEEDVPAPDSKYPGTATVRMHNIRDRVKSLTDDQMNGDWESVCRPAILWAGGLKDLRDASPGRGYTGHSFNDYNHCDLTAMVGSVSSNENRGQVDGIAHGNQLGPGIQIASLPELGPGGSWSTCMMGCNTDPPRDVAHVQFRSRIAFKLVWSPPNYNQFVLIDDDGGLLAYGSPRGNLPPMQERLYNYKLVMGSKYATVADKHFVQLQTTKAGEK